MHTTERQQTSRHAHIVLMYVCVQLVEVGMVFSKDLVNLETMLAFIE